VPKTRNARGVESGDALEAAKEIAAAEKSPGDGVD